MKGPPKRPSSFAAAAVATGASSSSSSLPPPLLLLLPPPRLLLVVLLMMLTLLISTPTTTVIAAAAAAAKDDGRFGGPFVVVDSTPPPDAAISASSSSSEEEDEEDLLERRDAEMRALVAEFDYALSRLADVGGALAPSMIASSLSSAAKYDIGGMHDAMDVVGTKSSELAGRTGRLLARVAGINRMAMRGGGATETGGGGLGMRLGGALDEEARRRDRHRRAAEASATAAAGDRRPSPEPGGGPGRYATLAELDDLLSPRNVVPPPTAGPPDDGGDASGGRRSEIAILAGEIAGEAASREDAALFERSRRSYELYQQHREEAGGDMGGEATAIRERAEGEGGGGSTTCLDVTGAIGLVGRALRAHRRDGTGGLADHARSENGGSVVHELTSPPYAPPPRFAANIMVVGSSRSSEELYDGERRRTFDEETEEAYWQDHRRRHATTTATASFGRLLEAAREANAWDWYSTFEFGSIRPYLPEDWERALDNILSSPSSSWSIYTPRAAIDALVPDYVYHALGVSAYGRTNHPDVAISSGGGFGVGGGGGGGDDDDDVAVDGGWTAKPAGHCYPLSMRPEDDPASALFLPGDGGSSSSALAAGPKYTVKLPYPIRIDAVTLEHRSFPVPRRDSERGHMGGESAPRWIRLVGFPPCPPPETGGEGGGGEEGDDDVGGCASRGFDIAAPIELGSFEYRRITVTGREDDYGGGGIGDDGDGGKGPESDDPFPGGRRRSIQTFAVKGGRYKPSSLLTDGGASSDDDIEIKEEEEEEVEDEEENAPKIMIMGDDDAPGVLAPGQCAPPKDEDSLPSCGGGGDTKTSAFGASSDGGGVGRGDRRKIVEAVSFIVEENWGNPEYTCLYRVRVHGDALG